MPGGCGAKDRLGCKWCCDRRLTCRGTVITRPWSVAAVDTPVAEFDRLLDRLGPSLKIMTVAPTNRDAKENHAYSRLLFERGVRVAMGHDRSACHDEIISMMRAASDYAEATQEDHRLHITHLFNVCKFHHRAPSLINFGMISKLPAPSSVPILREAPTVEVIVDNRHGHLLTIASLYQDRDCSDIALTDTLLAGEPGTKALDCGRPVCIAQDGTAVELAADGTLAGSCASQWQSYLHLHSIGLDAAAAATILSTTPARIARLERVGRIQVGNYADMVLVEEAQHGTQRISKTIVRGSII
eukprot:TRINITY_DN4946_c0_g1_i1.p1 TRINITY_DN4946_c0_g1~~TRINITY_DN4946_c0_g1_i1.p1  ORF type:complete len:300 (+),score=37.32 TRINITY_DN4946_c0_g1_i1:41-940(+)